MYIQKNVPNYFEKYKISFGEYVAENLNEIFEKKNIKVKKINGKKLDKTLNYEFNKNFIYHQGYDITIERVMNNNNISFTISKVSKKASLRFGCELETCLLLNCKSELLKDDELILKNKENLKEIRVKNKIEFDTAHIISKNKKIINVNKLEPNKNDLWVDMLITYLKYNIIPFLSKEFKDVFPYGYIALHPKNKKIDYEIDFENNTVTPFNGRTRSDQLIFTQDSSVRCGDTNSEDDNISIHCEIVSPILYEIEELEILYDNLISKICNYNDKSAGFHVNVSAVDENNNYINLTRAAISEILPQWIEFESMNYVKFRGEEGTEFAEEIGPIVKKYDKYSNLVKNKDGTPLSKDEYNNIIYTLNAHVHEKYRTIFFKNKNLIEFRIFPSQNTKEDLLSYTRDATNIFMKAVNRYIKNIDKIIHNLQSEVQNLIFDFSPMMSYQGPVTSFERFRQNKKEFEVLTYHIGDLDTLTYRNLYKMPNYIVTVSYIGNQTIFKRFIYNSDGKNCTAHFHDILNSEKVELIQSKINKIKKIHLLI